MKNRGEDKLYIYERGPPVIREKSHMISKSCIYQGGPPIAACILFLPKNSSDY